MRRSLKLTALAGAAVTIASLSLPAVAGADGFGTGGGPGGQPGDGFIHRTTVYVQTNDPTGNQIVTYVSDGSGLHQGDRTDSGGLGGAIPGAACCNRSTFFRSRRTQASWYRSAPGSSARR